MKRWGIPEDVGEAVAYFASEEAALGKGLLNLYLRSGSLELLLEFIGLLLGTALLKRSRRALYEFLGVSQS